MLLVLILAGGDVELNSALGTVRLLERIGRRPQLDNKQEETCADEFEIPP